MAKRLNWGKARRCSKVGREGDELPRTGSYGDIKRYHNKTWYLKDATSQTVENYLEPKQRKKRYSDEERGWA